MKLLNVGCGARFHPAWVNLDLEPATPAVQSWDVRGGLPYADSSFDAVYSSHVLEHLTPDEIVPLLREMHRVLKPGGTIRCVVPDLEGMARLYLDTIARLDAKDPAAAADHEWMVIELFDQTVRTTSGGRMTDFVSGPITNADFVRSRIGDYPDPHAPRVVPPLLARLRRNGIRGIARRLRFAIAALLVRVVGGRRAHVALREGWFRNSGEIHRWMYDRHSLGRLLQSIGFRDVTARTATTSRIPEFASYELDATAGRAHIPQSLFLEAVKA